MQVSLPSQAYIYICARYARTGMHAPCSFEYIYTGVGVIHNRRLGMLMPVVLASSSMIYLKVTFRYRRRHMFARSARAGMHAPCSFKYM